MKLTKIGLGLPLVAAFFAAGACSSSEREPSGSTGNGGGRAAPVESTSGLEPTRPSGQGEPELACDQSAADQLTQFREFSVELQTLYCQRQYECCSADERFVSPLYGEDTLESCVEAADNLNADPFVGEDNIACGRVHFRADLAAACLAEIRAANCEDVKQLPDCVVDETGANEIHLLLEPASPVGSVCEYGSATCIGGYCDTGGELYSPGKCATYKVANDACVEDYECLRGDCDDEDGCSSRSGLGEISFCRRL
jgi:hypothetical protein